MSKKSTSPDYIKILNILYIIISLFTMVVFLFVSTPKSDEYIGINSLAWWGTILSALIALLLAVGVILRRKQ